MDQAWKLEQHFWEELNEGRAAGFYARHMTSDGYVVLPSGVVERDDLIVRWEQHEPLTYELSEPRLLLVDGNVLVHYRVTADGSWLPDYKAYITSMYTWEGGEWALVFRQHTPEAEFAF
ncbi:hypothetical protein [Cryptosporangium phraense]|uniref:Nuclear transport factor 2 family protein n=1 Tax=Cryptosporangium phraense TaxID=2593070 RepID=A0A545AFT7_9ACTN|nr:hypothetical protein [Cryptosporangium phraense]TQS40204.1 hypothetical protein FL583_35885 [Cryptosporangium phraense]